MLDYIKSTLVLIAVLTVVGLLTNFIDGGTI